MPCYRSCSSRDSARKAAQFRREFERHRHGNDDSSDEDMFQPIRTQGQRSSGSDSDPRPSRSKPRKHKRKSYKETVKHTERSVHSESESEARDESQSEARDESQSEKEDATPVPSGGEDGQNEGRSNENTNNSVTPRYVFIINSSAD